MPDLPRRPLLGRQACCCYTNDAHEMKWRLCPVVRRTLLVFSEALICLSYTAVVPLHGFAPWSAAYRAAALLLSYRGRFEKWLPETVTLRRLPDVSRLLSF